MKIKPKPLKPVQRRTPEQLFQKAERLRALAATTDDPVKKATAERLAHNFQALGNYRRRKSMH